MAALLLRVDLLGPILLEFVCLNGTDRTLEYITDRLLRVMRLGFLVVRVRQRDLLSGTSID